MIGRVPRFCRILLCALLLAGPAAAAADRPAEGPSPAAKVDAAERLVHLDRELDALRGNLDRPWFWQSQLARLRTDLERIAETAERLRDVAVLPADVPGPVRDGIRSIAPHRLRRASWPGSRGRDGGSERGARRCRATARLKDTWARERGKTP